MAVYTFRNLYEMVLAQTDERDDVNRAREIVKELLNNAHESRCIEYADAFMQWDTPETFNTVTGQQQYSLHQLYDRPIYFFNRTTGQWLQEVPTRTVESEGYSLASTIQGSARSFTFWGHNLVKNQPTSASVLTLSSDHTSDTGADYQVVVKGVDSAGDQVAELITLSGTSTVTTTYTYTKVLAISKERRFNGKLTITSNSGAVTILTLYPDEFGRNYRQLWLIERPLTAETIEYRFYRKPTFLVNDYDIPDIPAPYSKILVYDALLQWGAYNTDTQDKNLNLWKEMQKQWEENLNRYVKEGQSLNARSRYVRTGVGTFDNGIDIAR